MRCTTWLRCRCGRWCGADATPVEAARQRWASTFNAADLPGLLALYHPQAVLWGTTSPVLLDTPAAIAAYFERTFATLPRPHVEMGQARTRVLGGVALCSGAYTLHLAAPGGQAHALPARFSFAYVLGEPGWQIVDHHSSVSP
ncbi:MAG: nuclear transport factor 2 family protein [Hydrogenophaga sp.]|nr:nuclear transport factor 2 family protein [Hydrogenophaga sp.]